ncbi:hypothetical protein SBA6_40076 [Candidatus Sulfopaludibacter sp. SbA6]|nr:hypothetical protein SBA6_40076 [Candidatus Sulfopaludibacter sp. SbA6]
MNELTHKIPTADEALRQLSEIQAAFALDPAAETDRHIRRLAQAIRNAEGRFVLLLAVCNDRPEQRRIARLIAVRLPHPPVELALTGKEDSLLDTLLEAPGAPLPLFVYGLEQLLPSGDEAVLRREDTLHELQLRREKFRKLARPLLLWVPEYAYTLIGQQAVDFWSWQSGGYFFPSPGLPQPAATAVGRRVVSNLPVSRVLVRRLEITGKALAILRHERGLMIVGQGGIGKTRLAIALAEELKEDFPDAQILLEAGSEEGTEAAARMIRQALWLLDPEIGLPEDFDALREMYLTALTSRRCVIILDNLREPALIRLLRPPPGSVLIVTARLALISGELPVLTLDALFPKDAREILLDAAPDLDQSRVDEIFARLGGNPLAIRLAAALLRQAPCVEKEALQSADLQTLFRRIYERLDQATAAVLRRCTVFPASFDREAEASVADDPENRHLLELERLAIVYRWKYADRFELNDLVRSLAGRYLPAAERFDLQLRHATHYLTVCHRVREAADSARPGWQQLLEAEWENIKAGQAWAAANYQTQADAAKLCCEYPIALGRILMNRLSPKEREQWFSAARDAARLRNDLDLEAHLCFLLAQILADQGKRDEATRTFLEAAQKARQAKHAYLAATSLMGAAWLTLDSGRTEEAEGLATEALEAARADGDITLTANALTTLVRVHALRGRFQDALRLNQEVFGLANQTRNRQQLSAAYRNAGYLYAETKDFARAVDAYQSALQIAGEIGDGAGQLAITRELGTVEVVAGQAERGIRHLEDAASMSRSRGDSAGIALALNSLAQGYYVLGDIRRAHSVALEALDIAKRAGEQFTRGALVNLGITSQRLGDYEGSERYLTQALSIARKLDDKDQEARILTELGRTYTQMGRHEDGERVLNEAAKLEARLEPQTRQNA